MIKFEFILTLFKSSTVFRGSRGSCVNWIEPKIEPPSANLACPNLWNALYPCVLKCLRLPWILANKAPRNLAFFEQNLRRGVRLPLIGAFGQCRRPLLLPPLASLTPETTWSWQNLISGISRWVSGIGSLNLDSGSETCQMNLLTLCWDSNGFLWIEKNRNKDYFLKLFIVLLICSNITWCT